MHRAAYRDGAFQRALAVEPLAFCRGCHAPEAPTDAAPSPELAEMGVGCITCHRAGDEVLAAPDARGASGAPHGLLRSAAFGGPRRALRVTSSRSRGRRRAGARSGCRPRCGSTPSRPCADGVRELHMPEVPSGVGEAGRGRRAGGAASVACLRVVAERGRAGAGHRGRGAAPGGHGARGAARASGVGMPSRPATCSAAWWCGPRWSARRGGCSPSGQRSIARPWGRSAMWRTGFWWPMTTECRGPRGRPAGWTLDGRGGARVSRCASR